MSILPRFRRFLRSIPARLYDTHVAEGEQFAALSSRAEFACDERLAERMREARERLPENSVKRLILEAPDTFVKTGHIPEDGDLPIG